MSRHIVSIDDPVLRTTAKEVPVAEIVTLPIQELIRDMKHLLANERLGVAIAAPQVGEAVRVFVVSGRALIPQSDDEKEEMNTPIPDDLVFINPTITKLSRKRKDLHEGCLSLPGFWGMVSRAERATIMAYNEKGEKVTRGASGLLAHIFQHEMDHLEGIIYTDKAHDVYEETVEPTHE